MCRATAPELRPKDRLLRHGPAALTDVELLAVLLRDGSPGQTALETAQHLLRAAGGLPKLLPTDRHSLRHCGAGEDGIAVLLASAEMLRRVTRDPLQERKLLDQPAEVALYVTLRYGEKDQEVFGALYLDCHYRLLAEREIFRGTLFRTTVEPRPILREALHHHAAAIRLWHTHPSGDPTPSDGDRRFTDRFASAAAMLGVRLVDHVIVGNGGQWVSFSRMGIMKSR